MPTSPGAISHPHNPTALPRTHTRGNLPTLLCSRVQQCPKKRPRGGGKAKPDCASNVCLILCARFVSEHEARTSTGISCTLPTSIVFFYYIRRPAGKTGICPSSPTHVLGAVGPIWFGSTSVLCRYRSQCLARSLLGVATDSFPWPQLCIFSWCWNRNNSPGRKLALF